MSQPTTGPLLEPILATEEEHADDLADLLQVMQPKPKRDSSRCP